MLGVAVTLIEGVTDKPGLVDTEGEGDGVGTTPTSKKKQQYSLYRH